MRNILNRKNNHGLDDRIYVNDLRNQEGVSTGNTPDVVLKFLHMKFLEMLWS